MVLPLLKRLVAGFPLRWPEFGPRSDVEFVVDTVALGQVFSEYFGFALQILIPPTVLHSYVFGFITETSFWIERKMYLLY
jgi:hypothetical protein